MVTKIGWVIASFFCFLRRIGIFDKLKNWRIVFSTLMIKGSFRSFGIGSTIQPRCFIHGEERISIGNGVHIRSGSWLGTYKSGEIFLGDGTLVGFNCKITARRKISIGRNVLFSDNVYISDVDHLFEQPDISVKEQGMTIGHTVTIEDDVWLGQNAVIRPGVTIGRHSVVGSSSVVTKSVPAFSVVSGAPARVIRKYDQESKSWVRIRNSETNEEF